ncbi:hypothetical protein CDAR_401591 [Caerostris darwini]|uniref:Uncharacterized protein n=1 Tax=Caerostris darwini TaxID=1538125 RepID=A0AAV4RTG2_9ARAC|nr:hypothetical protein CDAR_401591 [Caerostris darwini]
MAFNHGLKPHNSLKHPKPQCLGEVKKKKMKTSQELFIEISLIPNVSWLRGFGAKPILKRGIYDLVQLFMDQPRGRVGVYRLLSTSRGPGTKLYLLADRNVPVEQERHSKITFPIHRGDC